MENNYENAPMQGNTAGMGQENGFWGERQQEAF